jgi:hypothetical protein
MLSWMDKEPLVMRQTPGGGNMRLMTSDDGHRPTPEEIERTRKEAERQMREAEAKRRIVEYRLFYGEYKAVDGVRLPSKIQRMVDGLPTEELVLDNIRINGTLPGETFKGR